SGPYLMLPILGPSNPRDAIGAGIDSYADPVAIFAKIHGFEEISIGRFAADGIDQRAQVLDVLDDLRKNSLDFYSQLRSLSQQRRASDLRRGVLTPDSNFYTDPGTSSAVPSPPTPPPAALKPAAAAAPRVRTATSAAASPPVAARPPL